MLCLLLCATTQGWVKNIGRSYQTNVVSVDVTDKWVRTEKGVRNIAIQVSYGKREILDDNIAVEISHNIDPTILAPKDDQSGTDNQHHDDDNQLDANNEQKTQYLLLLVTTPGWVKNIDRSYQTKVVLVNVTID